MGLLCSCSAFCGPIQDQELDAINSRANYQAQQVAREFRMALHAHLFQGKPFPGSSMVKFLSIALERQKEVNSVLSRPQVPLPEGRVPASQPRFSSQRTGAQRAPAQHGYSHGASSGGSRPEVVIDGSNVPKELVFPGRKSPERKPVEAPPVIKR